MSTTKEIKLLMSQLDDLLKINIKNLDKKLFQIPPIHNKILKLFFKHKMLLQTMNRDLSILFAKKWRHYKYEQDEVLTDKTCMFFIEGDEEYANKKMELGKQQVLVEYLTKAVDKASKLGFDVKNIIDYLKYLNGGA